MAEKEAKSKRPIIILAVVIIIVIIIIIGMRGRPNPELSKSTPALPGGTPTPPIPDAPTPTPTTLLTRGDRGVMVEYIQRGLNRILSLRGETLLRVDGVWGSKTDAAVERFMNTGSTSYIAVKQKVIAIYGEHGEPNPYGTEDDTEPFGFESAAWIN